jgi:dTDP-4-dehydrorhamnose reductase
MCLRESPCELGPVPTSGFPTPAQRRHNSRLDTARLQQTFGLHELAVVHKIDTAAVLCSDIFALAV